MPSSIFQFHPLARPKKKKATPRSTTPRNLVFPEPGDAAVELPVAPERVHSGSTARDDVHRRSKQPPEPKLPTSAHKYLSPQQDGIDAKQAHEPPADSNRANQLEPRRLRELAPRSLRGKIHFYGLRVCQSANGSLRGMRLLHRQLSFQRKIAYLLILCGMLSESATPAPRYNVPIGIVVFMCSTSHFDHRMAVAGLCLAIFVDIVWLLRPQEGSFNGYFRAQYANYTHACLGICTLIKVWLVFSTYSDLGPEPVAAHQEQRQQSLPDASTQQSPPARSYHPVWQHIKFFFPRKTYPRCSHLSFEVLMRTLALVWIHGLCGIALLMLGVLSATLYSDKVQFRSSTLGAPLHVMMLIRSATTLASYFVATQHMSYNGCLKLFGCHRIAEIGESEDGGGGSDIVLKYNKRWLLRVQRAKALDALAGVYFVLVFYSAFHSGQFFAGSGLTAVLVITGLIVLVLDFWAPLLIMVVAKCGAMLHTHHKRGTVDVDPYYPNQLEWEENDDSGADKDGSSSGSDSSSSSGGRSSDSSSLSSSSSSRSSSSGYTTTSSQIRRRRQRRLHRRERKEEKRQARALSRGNSSSSRKPLLTPFKRQNSTPIVDAHEVLSSRMPDRGWQQETNSQLQPSLSGVWVRHWHEASGRSYLVHSDTGETVWEMANSQSTASRSEKKFPSSAETTTPRTALASARRRGSSDKSIAPSTAHGRGVPDDSTSPSTSDSEVVVTTSQHSPRPGLSTGRLSARRSSFTMAGAQEAQQVSGDTDHTAINDQRLTPHEFRLLWDALPDGGSFVCRVSRIPNALELGRHLLRHNFVVASDELNDEDLRVAHFYAAVVTACEMEERFNGGNRGGRLSARLQEQFFLGEFIFDSLTLKLIAKFRCPRQDAIVPFVKRLQLKEIVGSYAPCE